MTETIAGVIAAALGGIGAYFTWKASASHQRKLAEDKVAEENAAAEAKKTEIREAVYGNDDEKLNKIVSKLLED